MVSYRFDLHQSNGRAGRGCRKYYRNFKALLGCQQSRPAARPYNHYSVGREPPPCLGFLAVKFPGATLELLGKAPLRQAARLPTVDEWGPRFEYGAARGCGARMAT
jgi:hypothetical protein